MSAFSQMKKSRMSFDNLAKKIDDDKSGGFKKDDRMYYPQLDENKNGQAVIRFLPPSEGEDTPWVKGFSHGFKGKGGWFIQECPTTVKADCPVCTANSALWESGIEKDKEVARGRKRRISYYANILVVEDKKNPENEGKVFIYKFGTKIFDKIKGALHPEFDDEAQINPFDLWEGANFRLRIRKFEGNVNYDKSDFGDVCPVAKTDKEIEGIWKSQHKLSEFTAADRFKPFDELNKMFARVTGTAASTTTANELSESEAADSVPAEAPKQKAAPAPKAESAPSGDEEDPMEYFRQLQEDG